MNETWRPITGLEGRYSVSDMGAVRSETRTDVQPRYPQGRTYQGRLLRTCINENGYEIATLPRWNGKRSFRVHRLVAEAFLGTPPYPDMDVNHKNGVRSDNRAENLEWCTRSENLTHGYRVNRTPHRVARGEAAGTAKLTEAAVLEIRRRRDRGEVLDTIARDFGVDRTNVWRIGKRTSWSHLPEATP
jgi:hypothetical protein